MTIFRCKICGGTLEITSGETVATCEYCGTKQTLPKLDDEKKANLFDRANHFRRNNDFDKAMGIYEQILNEDTEDAECYWSIVLCRYGIEYVEDPSSRKRVPTVNRAQFTSVFDDEDYKSAIKYADAHQKELYEKEATAINEIQKGILAISGQEEPFDVFICYKETDANGRRTQDSVLATELYHELTREGYKVFFSRITLEDKLGTAYEPYIFAALNSSKVMVVLGTRPEHFNAVWVKNEWSRYLALIKQGQKKMLIPAYRDMDPYDLPEEFSHLQAQDMSKLGFMQDLVRGITKLVSVENATTVKETVVVQSSVSGNASALVKRGFLALEDGDWNKADEFFEQALNQDAEDAQAYLGKLMAELQVKTQSALKDCKEPFNSSTNYQKAIRFADAKLKSELNDYIGFIKDRNESERLQSTYENAVQRMNIATTEESFKAVSNIFKGIAGYKDSKELSEICLEKAEVARKEHLYNVCSEVFIGVVPSTIKNWEAALSGFNHLGDYKDSPQKADECLAKIGELKRKTEEERIKKERELEEKRLEQERKRLEEERQKELKRIAKEKARKRNKKLAIIITTFLTICIATILLLNYVILPNNKYNNAIELMENQKYEESMKIFAELGDYKDSIKQISNYETAIKETKYNNAIEMMKNKKYEESIKIFSELGDYKDSLLLITDCKYNYALASISDKDYTQAIATLMTISDYKDSKMYIKTYYEKIDKNIMVDGHSTYGLKSDGTVVAVGTNQYGELNVSGWKDIVEIKTCLTHTVGLKSDGTVVAVGDNDDGQCEVSGWKDIVAISVEAGTTIGLKSDGTVVATGSNYNGVLNVSGWKDIVEIKTCSTHTVGLKSDGTVVATGYNRDGQCNVSNWKNVISISVSSYNTIGLCADGTLITEGYCNWDFSGWNDITSFCHDNFFVVGLKSDGTVVTEGSNLWWSVEDVTTWRDIIAISNDSHIVGLKSDGTVVATGRNTDGECNVENWSNIIAVVAGEGHTVGLKSDGTVVAIGNNESGQCEVSKWNLFI